MSRSPAIVKLGGSLVGGPELAEWVRALVDAGPVVIVPGGGPFADAVRAAQPRIGFDDATAHHLALLAMEQLGRALVAMDRGLRAAPTRTALTRALGRGLVPVWLPARMVLRRPEIPASWEVTSDSLAAWLAGELGADRLLLVKAAPPPAESASADELARAGLVDPRFAGFLARSGATAWCVGADQPAVAAAALRAGAGAGTRLAGSREPPPDPVLA